MKKTILITGGSRGIGEATVRAAANDMNVVFTYLSSEKRAKEIEEELKPFNVVSVKCDVRDGASVKRAVDFALSRFKQIDILVNNAGVSCDKLLIDMSDEDWDECFSVNAGGVFKMTKAVLPHMLSNMSGSIVNVSSVWGVSGASGEVAYSASKSAVIGFTKALAKEVAPMGVRVNAIAPGAIDTDMMRAYGAEVIESLCKDTIPLNRLGRADEVAKTVLFVAQNEYMSGSVVSVDGLLS